MAIEVKILADSMAPCGKRLTTRLWKYPRSIHSEIMTHGMLARNSASSRAIPTEKLIQMVVDDPFIPEYIGSNQKGMQAGEELREDKRQWAVDTWLRARDAAVEHARHLLSYGVHKQVVNRLVEPWMWITVIVSATENENLWGLRCHPAAEPHFQKLAYMDRDAVAASTPKVLKAGEWHTPLVPIDDEDITVISRYVVETATSPERLVAAKEQAFLKISVGRCARVSYLTHDGRRDPKEDVALHDRLVGSSPLHASPAEHVAQAMDYPSWYRNLCEDIMPSVAELQQRVLMARSIQMEPTPMMLKEEAALAQMRSGKFLGFRQYRKTLPNEHIGGMMP